MPFVTPPFTARKPSVPRLVEEGRQYERVRTDTRSNSPVIDTDDDDIAAAGHVSPLIYAASALSAGELATMDPEHDWAQVVRSSGVLGKEGRVYIQEETVFASGPGLNTR